MRLNAIDKKNLILVTIKIQNNVAEEENCHLFMLRNVDEAYYMQVYA